MSIKAPHIHIAKLHLKVAESKNETMLWIRIVLTIVSVIVLCLMVYINIHAMRHDVAGDISHGTLLRMLEQSVEDYSPSSSSGTDDGAQKLHSVLDESVEITSNDIKQSEARIEKLEKDVQEMLQKIEDEQTSLYWLSKKKIM